MATNPVDTRLAYVRSFNATMLEIWHARIALLKVIDTGALYNSIVPVKALPNSDASDVEYEWKFLEYGVYQDRGVGHEVYRGNPGDIGRAKIREARPWLSTPFWRSAMNLKEFMAKSLGREAMSVLSNAFEDPITGTVSL